MLTRRQKIEQVISKVGDLASDLKDEDLFMRTGGQQTDLLDTGPSIKTLEGSLYKFCKAAWQVVEPETRFIGNWHIEAMADHYEALRASKFTDLLINVPPGCCKSIMSCVMFPAWIWTTWPSARFLFASYDQALSIRDSIRCRNLLVSDWYRHRWGRIVALTLDENQKTRFSNTAGGYRIATSVGGRGTGEHPDFILADDPHNVKKAESETERRAVKTWWSATISTRGRIRGSRRSIIMQRLHEDDLSGDVLSKGRVTHLCLPMRFESERVMVSRIGWHDPRLTEGELLWPEAFDESLVKELETELGSLAAAGQLQQRPAPAGGHKFKRAWYRVVTVAPSNLQRVTRYWDKAGTEDAGNYSAGVLMGMHERIIYIMDVVRGQWSALNRNKIIAQTAEIDACRFGKSGFTTFVEQEPGSSGKESIEFTIRQLIGFKVYADKVTGEKISRMDPLAAYSEAGNVVLVGGQWNAAFLDELVAIPFGKYDDQADAAAGCYNKMTQAKRFLVA